MRIDIFRTIAVIVASALIGWAFGALTPGHDQALFTGIGGFLVSAVCLMAGVGMAYDDGRYGTNIRLLSMLFLVLFIVTNSIFAFFEFTAAPFCIVNGLLLIIFVMSVSGILRAAKSDGLSR